MSLKPGWMIAILMSWLVARIIFGVTEMVYLGGTSDMSSFEIFLGLSNLTDTSTAWDYVSGIWDMLSWNYAFLGGAWSIVRFFLTAITAGIGFSLVIMVVSILANAVGGILSIFKGVR